MRRGSRTLLLDCHLGRCEMKTLIDLSLTIFYGLSCYFMGRKHGEKDLTEKTKRGLTMCKHYKLSGHSMLASETFLKGMGLL